MAAGALAVAACSSAATTAGPGRASVPPGQAAATAPASTTTASPTTSTTTVAAFPPGTLSQGQWTPVGLAVHGKAALTATMMAAPEGPRSGVVRINGALTRPVLFAGTSEPGGSWPNQGAVPSALQGALVAAFNSGFHTSSSGGGWFDHGRTAVPLVSGAASLVIRGDGSATVGMWGRDVSLTADVISVRQNLGLLVDAGVNFGNSGYWGAVLGGGINTWRSGLGVDPAGNLLYASGPALSAASLAQVLIQAGAVRAMELDINPQWVAFAYYDGTGGGTNLLPAMHYPPNHWLTGTPRDFIAIMVR